MYVECTWTYSAAKSVFIHSHEDEFVEQKTCWHCYCLVRSYLSGNCTTLACGTSAVAAAGRSESWLTMKHSYHRAALILFVRRSKHIAARSHRKVQAESARSGHSSSLHTPRNSAHCIGDLVDHYNHSHTIYYVWYISASSICAVHINWVVCRKNSRFEMPR